VLVHFGFSTFQLMMTVNGWHLAILGLSPVFRLPAINMTLLLLSLSCYSILTATVVQ